MTRVTGNLLYCRFLITYRSVLLRMRNVSNTSCTEIKAHILCSVTIYFRKSSRLWDNVENTVERGRPRMAIWRMCIAWWITKAAGTHTEYVTLTAFGRQQWLHEITSLLRHTYSACIVGTWLAMPYVTNESHIVAFGTWTVDSKLNRLCQMSRDACVPIYTASQSRKRQF